MTVKPVVARDTVDYTFKIQKDRTERYRLQSAVRYLYIGEGLKQKLDFPQNFHRTAKCSHNVHYNSDDYAVGIHKSKKYKKAFYSGLMTCGCVWTCPVCAAKIQEKRRIEIARAFDWAYGQNKKVIMTTFTFPHQFDQGLSDLLDMQSEAFGRLRSGKRWVNLKKKYGFIGLIRALEVTYGSNGWHPHTHEAWIVDSDADVNSLLQELLELWFKSCSSVGLIKDKRKKKWFFQRAVQITDNCSTSEYLAKQDDSKHWGADRELSKATSKSSKKTIHPFMLISKYADDKEDKHSARKFLEYTKAMYRKRQIYWSTDLKNKVGLKDKTDEELANEKEDKADLLMAVDYESWKLIIKNKARAKVLDIAENYGYEKLRLYLSGLYYIEDGKLTMKQLEKAI